MLVRLYKRINRLLPPNLSGEGLHRFTDGKSPLLTLTHAILLGFRVQHSSLRRRPLHVIP